MFKQSLESRKNLIFLEAITAGNVWTVIAVPSQILDSAHSKIVNSRNSNRKIPAISYCLRPCKWQFATNIKSALREYVSVYRPSSEIGQGIVMQSRYNFRK